MWTATLANDKATFEKFIEPVYLFMNVTPNRVPMSDWVFTDEPNQKRLPGTFRCRWILYQNA